jgi:hypothetical protein
MWAPLTEPAQVQGHTHITFQDLKRTRVCRTRRPRACDSPLIDQGLVQRRIAIWQLFQAVVVSEGGGFGFLKC